jgi:hypothetical protein
MSVLKSIRGESRKFSNDGSMDVTTTMAEHMTAQPTSNARLQRKVVWG